MQISKAGNSNKGFTLLEIIMVLFILALTMGLVLPEVGTVLQGDPLKTSVKRLISAVAQARNQAMLDGEPWEIVLNTDTGFEQEESASLDKKKRQLIVRPKDGIRFRDVAFIRTGEVISQQDVFLIFLPNGLAEPVLVHCESRDGTVKTVYLKAFNPRPVIMDGDRSLEGLFGEG